MSSIDPLKFVDEHGDALFRYAIVRLRDEAIAEDLIQETLLAALRGADRFAGTSGVRGWLIGILKHKIIDHYRSNRFIVDIGSDDDLFGSDDHWLDDSEPQSWNRSTPQNDLENKELAHVLRDALAAIPHPLSTIFALREIEGLGREEICELFGISNANYWVILHRARIRLRVEVEARWQTSELPRRAPLRTAFETA